MLLTALPLDLFPFCGSRGQILFPNTSDVHQPQHNWLGLRHGAGRRSFRRCLSTEIRLLHLHLLLLFFHLPTKERLTLVNHFLAEDPPPSRLKVTRARKLLSQLPISMAVLVCFASNCACDDANIARQTATPASNPYLFHASESF